MKSLLRLFTIIIIFTLCGVWQLYAQDRFRRLTVNDGISQSDVTCFLKSRSGYMWFGTVGGLDRYDGYSITNFNTHNNDPYAIRANKVLSLCEDNSNRIWIGTNTGLSVFDERSEKFYTIDIPNTTPNILIVKIELRDDVLWISTNEALYYVYISEVINLTDPIDFHKISIPLPTPERYVYFTDFDFDKNGDMWLSCVSAIYKYSNGKLHKIFEVDKFDDFLGDGIEVDINNNIWFSYDDKCLIRYNPQKNIFKRFAPTTDSNKFAIQSRKINCIEKDKDDNLWLGTKDKGLMFVGREELNAENVNFKNIERNIESQFGLTSNYINSIYCDFDMTWVGTRGGGVNYLDYNQKGFKSFQTLTKDYVSAIHIDDSCYWVGTLSNGLHKINKEDGISRKFALGFDIVYYIEQCDEHRLFVCAESGLYVINKSSGSIEQFIPETKYAYHICKGDGNLWWLATRDGLFRLEVNNGYIDNQYNRYTTRSTPAMFYNNSRCVVYNPKYNELWVGSEESGVHLIKLNDQSYPVSISMFSSINEQMHISNNYVRDIAMQNPNIMWVATGEGVNKIERIDGEFKTIEYNTESGLENNIIQSIVVDDLSNVWVGTNKGLSKIESSTESIINYNTNDGLLSLEFNEHTRDMSEKGELLFGGAEGFTIFNPASIRLRERTYMPNITAFYLFGNLISPGMVVDDRVIIDKAIHLTDEIELKPNEDSFRFEFSSMSYSSQNVDRYLYRLKGYDKTWQETNYKSRVANYTNLNSGEYIFQVYTINEKGGCSNYREVKIVIATPFYLRWYSIAFYFILLILIFIFVTNGLALRKKQLYAKRHQEKLYELERSRMHFFINISHDLQTPLALILGPIKYIFDIENLNGAVKENLEIVKRNAQKLQLMINQILDIRKSENGHLEAHNSLVCLNKMVEETLLHFKFAFEDKGLELLFEASEQNITTVTDANMVDKVIFNVVSNSLKYTKVGQCKITLSCENGNAIIEVSDTGVGIAKNQIDKIFERFYNNPDTYVGGYGIGLSHSRDLMKVLGGEITVKSNYGKGSTFKITLPITEITQSDRGGETSGVDDRISILVVDDEDDMRLFIRNIFSLEYKVLEAKDGVHALEVLKREQVDIVVSDIMMPNKNGVELCQEIKADIEISHIPVILLTAMNSDHIRYKGFEIGAVGYINKPFDAKELYHRVRNVISSRKVLKSDDDRFVVDVSAQDLTSKDEQFLTKVLDCIKKEYSNTEFTIEFLEREMAMSHACFYRKIKALTGMSAKSLLQSVRLRKAEQILLNSDMRITEVAEAVGFNNLVNFSSCFKEKNGVTPMQYRKSNKK